MRARIRAGSGQGAQGEQTATARGDQHRGVAARVSAADRRAAGQQRRHDLGIVALGGHVQGSTSVLIGCVDPCLVAKEQNDAGRVILARGRCHDRRNAGLGLTGGAAVEQKFCHAPVTDRTGHGQRAHPGVIERIRLGAGIEQGHRHRRVGAACGVVQRSAAVGAGDAGIGTVGQQGGDRLRPTMPAVAGGRQQGCQTRLHAVEIDTGADQRAQQTQIGQDRSEHCQRSLVAVVGCRQCVRIGAGLKQGQGRLDISGHRRRIQTFLDARCVVGRAGQADRRVDGLSQRLR